MELINVRQAMAILGHPNTGIGRKEFIEKYKIQPAAQNGNGNGTIVFFDKAEVEARAFVIREDNERKAKERAERAQALALTPSAQAHRFIAADVMSALDRIEAKIDKLLAALS